MNQQRQEPPVDLVTWASTTPWPVIIGAMAGLAVLLVTRDLVAVAVVQAVGLAITLAAIVLQARR